MAKEIIINKKFIYRVLTCILLSIVLFSAYSFYHLEYEYGLEIRDGNLAGYANSYEKNVRFIFFDAYVTKRYHRFGDSQFFKEKNSYEYWLELSLEEKVKSFLLPSILQNWFQMIKLSILLVLLSYIPIFFKWLSTKIKVKIK